MTKVSTHRLGARRVATLALLAIGGFSAVSVAVVAVPAPARAQDPPTQQKSSEFQRREREIRQLQLQNKGLGAVDQGLGVIGGAAQGVKSYITDPLVNSFHWILTQLVFLLVKLMEFIIDLAGKLLNVVLRVDTYADAQIVKEGWKFVRDLLNFLFVPALLALAFSTIAGIESYEMRRWLPRIIVAALFVNFSLGIGGGINAVATAAMNLLGGGQNGNLGQTLVTSLQKAAQTEVLHQEKPEVITKEVSSSLTTQGSAQPQTGTTPATSLEPWKLLVAQIAQLIILTVAAIVFFLLFLLFLLRVVALYILLILSPIGFAFSILPQLAPLAQRWWRSFLQWVIFGPAALTLVVLAARLAGQDSTQGALTNVAANAQLGAIANVAFNTLMVCLFLLAALFVGREMGIAGASAIAGWGSAAAKGSAYWLSGAGAGAFAGRALWTRTGGAAMEGYRQAQAQRQKDRVRTGFFGQLGTRVGAGFSPTAQQAIQRRQEDEEVKDLKTRGVPLDQLKLNNVAHARYAAQEGLYEGASEDQNRQILETLTRAGRTGTGEFGRVRKDYLMRLPHTGVKNLAAMGAIPTGEIANEQKKAVGKLGGLDYVKAMQNEQKQGVNLLEQYPITGGHVRSVYEHGGDAESRTLLAQRGGPRFTRGAETEVRRREPQSPTGPPPGPVIGGGPGV